MKFYTAFFAGAMLTFGGSFGAESLSLKNDVLPILETHCFKCHGANEQESDLRLDSRAGMLTGGDYGPAIVPGDAAKSYLIKLVTTDDAELRMPPEGKRLSREQVATLKKWIAKGAVWPGQMEDVASKRNRASDHWSFQPLPTDFAHDSIDEFVHAKLNERGLHRSPEANRRALIRRVTLDLTGLPPTPEEVVAFLADNSANAWQTVVDRLLESPAYGDRWAQHWLDVIRYADSRGYEFNSLRGDTWPFRDWVIAAFNEDLPWNDFLYQQIAGDTIGIDPATGFLVTAPLPTPPEVGREAAQIRQARFNALDEIVQNVGASMLGLTVGCARCHEHKFDPISARDYYRVVSVFSGVQFNRRLWRSKDSERKKKVAALDAKLSEIEAELRTLPVARTVERGRYTDFFHAVDARWVRLNIDETDAKSDGPVFDEIEIFSAGKDVNVALASLGAIASSSGVAKHLGGRDEMLNDGKFGGGSIWTADRIPPAWVQIQLPEPTQIDRLTWSRDRDLAVSDSARHAIRLTTAWRIEVAVTEGKWQPVVPRFRGGSSPTKAQKQRQHELETHRDDLQQQLNAMSAPLQVFAGSFINPEPIHLLMRGDPSQPLDRVGPGALEILKGFELTPGSASETERRAAFAKWLTKEAAHLSARVAVNRIWQHHFGTGLVDTPNDFGVMGSRPTHPDLLDWLAAEFIDSGWKMKSLHRRILTSATYRQSSSSRDQSEALHADADTRLLWRFPPRRLDAETIRDSMLSISGNLDRKRGGEGVNIFTRQGSFDQWKPLADPPAGSNRRMIYLTRIRGVDDGMFKTFDLPECGQVKDKRTVSTTPLQALNLLNGPFCLEQSAALAKRIGKGSEANLNAQVTKAFERILGRAPNDEELKLCHATAHAEGLETVCRALFNSNEFLFLP